MNNDFEFLIEAAVEWGRALWDWFINHRLLIIILCIVALVYMKCSPSHQESEAYKYEPKRPKTGNVYTPPTNTKREKSNIENENKTIPPAPAANDRKEVDEYGIPIKKKVPVKANQYEGWEDPKYKTGSTPLCYNYSFKKDNSLNNRLSVSVGSNTDVVIKLFNKKTNECIRYVYIRGGSSFDIKNIPEGVYYIKVAYGTMWKQNIEENKCVGKFTQNAIYKKGEETFNFNRVYAGEETDAEGNTYDTWSIPSYELSLDVISSKYNKGVEFDEISEEDFND